MKNIFTTVTSVLTLLLVLFFEPINTHSSMDSMSKRKLYQIKGKILVSFKQTKNETDYFSWNGTAIKSRLSSYELSTLISYGLKRCRKAYHSNGRAIYDLRFDARANEERIIQYAKTLSNVEFVQLDYYPEFCLDPNDYYYQPDSEDSSRHWVPYDYNFIYGNSDDMRHCESKWDDCCTSDDYIYPCASYRDSLHLDDQWYLQHVQADKAWDIEFGDADVKIMVMDSGIDYAHPDLDGNMWNNSDDELGDMNDDGLPGSSGDDLTP